MKIVAGLLLAGLLAAALAVWQGWVGVPAAWNPWAPLDLRQPPNPLSAWKLARLRGDPTLCAQALATSALRYRPQADTQGACPLQNVVRVQGGEAALSSSFLASCPMAVAFFLFEENAVQPAAQAVFGMRVTRIEHLGSYACRNVYHRAQGRRSQHASANALDIAGFRLADGREVSVLRDWSGDDAKARFLRQVRDGACNSFSTVLGPEYNAAHRNHFHLDAGGWSVCR